MKTKAHYFFVAPAMILLFTFSIIPLLFALVLSFSDTDLAVLRDFGKFGFVGLENYIELLTDPAFLQTIVNTLYYVIFGVPFVILFALAFALGIHFVSGKIGSLFRGLFYLPAITNTVAIAFVWLLLYNKSYGIFNYVLSVFGASPIDWIGDPTYAKASLIILAVWKGIGLNMIILLAGITAIPKDYYEAACIDGANAIQRFFKITLPQLKFAIFFVIVTTVIGWMQFFDEIYVLKIKETAEAKSMAVFIYESAFKQNDYGLGSAASMILFAMILLITIIQLRMQLKGDEK